MTLKSTARLVLALATLALAAWWLSRPTSSRRPSCDGLDCSKQSDCGSRCTCLVQPGQAIGRCVS
jgi:hypothetical protein